MVGYKPGGDVQLTNTDHAVAGAVSSALSRAIGQPLDVLKIRFQVRILVAILMGIRVKCPWASEYSKLHNSCVVDTQPRHRLENFL